MLERYREYSGVYSMTEIFMDCELIESKWNIIIINSTLSCSDGDKKNALRRI